MRSTFDKPFGNKATNDTLFEFLSKKEYHKPPVILLVNTISDQLSKAVPIAFASERPKSETIFNNYVHSFIEKERANYEREHPSIPFALCKSVPDHAINGYQLLIESKYVRGSTSPSRVTEGIAADLTKYPTESHKLFIVYDPERQIVDDEKFKSDFESKKARAIAILKLSDKKITHLGTNL